MPQLGIYSEREVKEAKDLVKELIRVVRACRLYAQDHPALKEMADTLRRRWEEATAAGPIALRFTERKVLLDEEPVHQAPGNTHEVIPSALYEHGVVGFVLQPGLEPEETRRLVAALSADPGGTADYPSLLWEADLPHVQVLVDVDDADEDPITTPADFAQQVTKLADGTDVLPGSDYTDARAAPAAPVPPAHLPLDAEEQARLQELAPSERYVETVRHALRVVHAMASEPAAPDEAGQIEKILGDLLGAVLASGDLPAATEAAARARALAGSSTPLEMRAGELTLSILVAPANLRAFLRTLDDHQQVDARALGGLLVELGRPSAPTVAAWLLETKFPAAVQDAMRVYREAAAEALVPLYASGGSTRERAGGALLELGTDAALTTLAGGFRELTEETRLRLLQHAGRSRDAGLRRVLLDALDDPSEGVRRAAIGAIKRQDAPRLAAVAKDLLDRGVLETRYRAEMEDFFEMLSRAGDGSVARLLADHCMPRGFRLGFLPLTPVQQLSARALRRMRAPDARLIVEELRNRAPRAVREILDDPLGD
ncbi:MAG TPA: hypothetical protein VFY93_16500 [Planctomycetota bacterium]|nr:hypothetical protein [Planctomycetota bacterium]